MSFFSLASLDKITVFIRRVAHYSKLVHKKKNFCILK